MSHKSGKKSNFFRQIYEMPYTDSNKVKLYSSAKGSLNMVQRLSILKKLPIHNGCVNCICWSDNGEYLLSGSDDRHLVLTNATKDYKTEISYQTKHEANIFNAKFLPNRNNASVISCCGNGLVIHSDLSVPPLNNPETNIFSCHTGTVYELATLPQDPNTFLSAGEDYTVRCFDLRVKSKCHNMFCKDDILIQCRRAITAISVNKMVPYQMAIGTSDSTVRIFDRRMLEAVPSGLNAKNTRPIVLFTAPGLEVRPYRFTSVEFSPNGHEVLASYSSEYLYLFDIESGNSTEFGKSEEPVETLPESFESVHKPETSPVRKLRLRGDWSDTGPDARPQRPRFYSARTEVNREFLANELRGVSNNNTTTMMQRFTDLLSEMINDPTVRSAIAQENLPQQTTATTDDQSEESESSSEEDLSSTSDDIETETPNKKVRVRNLDRVKAKASNKSLGVPIPTTSKAKPLESKKTSKFKQSQSNSKSVKQSKSNSKLLKKKQNDTDNEDLVDSLNMDMSSVSFDSGSSLPVEEANSETTEAMVEENNTRRTQISDQTKTDFNPVNVMAEENRPDELTVDRELRESNSFSSGKQSESQPTSSSTPTSNDPMNALNSEPVVPLNDQPTSSCSPVGSEPMDASNNVPIVSLNDEPTSPYTPIKSDAMDVSNCEPIVPLNDQSTSSTRSEPVAESIVCLNPSPNEPSTSASTSVQDMPSTSGEVSESEPAQSMGLEPSMSSYQALLRRRNVIPRTVRTILDTWRDTSSRSRWLRLPGNDPPVERSRSFNKKNREGPGFCDDSARRVEVKQKFTGHRNARTMIKEATFWGDDFIMSGSDCGHVFVWDKSTAELVMLILGDKHVVNCIQPHPTLPLLATSGIDYDVKIWEPLLEESGFDVEMAEELLKRNEIMFEQTKDTITIPVSLMIQMLTWINRLRGGRSLLTPMPGSERNE